MTTSIDLNTLLTLLQPVNLSTSTLDVRHWKLKENCLFTVNFLYRSLTGYRNETNCFQWIWTTQAPFKTKMHMLLPYHDHLLTVDNLAKRDIHITSPRKLCGVHSETNAYIFLQCPLSLELWASERNRLHYLRDHHPLHPFEVIGDFLISYIIKFIDGIVSSGPPFG